MKTKMYATLLALASVVSIGLPAAASIGLPAAADDVSVGATHHSVTVLAPAPHDGTPAGPPAAVMARSGASASFLMLHDVEVEPLSSGELDMLRGGWWTYATWLIWRGGW